MKKAKEMNWTELEAVRSISREYMAGNNPEVLKDIKGMMKESDIAKAACGRLDAEVKRYFKPKDLRDPVKAPEVKKLVEEYVAGFDANTLYLLLENTIYIDELKHINAIAHQAIALEYSKKKSPLKK
jgi:hypothetical protein